MTDFIKVDRYRPRHPMLTPLIKYFWVLKSNRLIRLEHKLLPVNNIDVVLDFSGSTSKGTALHDPDGSMEEAPKNFFRGIRDRYHVVKQAGKFDMLGISFFPTGLYPFLKAPLSEFSNKTIGLDDVLPNFVSTLGDKYLSSGSIVRRIELVEKCLTEFLNPDYIPDNQTYRLLRTFHQSARCPDIRSFCDRQGIHQRRLERIFHRYIGTSPKFFKRLTRFQGVLSKLLNDQAGDLTSLAHENDYYDQSHFIKDFKSFTGSSPSRFLKEKRSVKEIIQTA